MELQREPIVNKNNKMSYTFLEMRMDSVNSHFENEMLRKLMESSNKCVVGTTVELETDECGAITKICNLSEVKKQAKALFKSSIKVIADMPEVKEMKKIGFNLETVANKTMIGEVGKLSQTVVSECYFSQRK